MTWPFENDTSAVVKKLANRSIKADKRSKAFLFLTIALAVCMVFSILLISIGTQEEYKNTQRNKAQIGILGITDEQAGLLHQNTDVSWIGEYSAIGLFYQDNKTITVAYGNEAYFLNQEEKTFQGNIPQKKTEIMLPQNYIDFLGKAYQVGDTITLDLTGTGQEEEYTLSGILADTKESNGYYIYVNKELAHSLSGSNFQVTAYTRLNTDVISPAAILDFAAKAIKDTGIEEGQINLTEYFAVMSGAIKSGIPISVPLLAAITATLAATIIYGVFYTKIVKNVMNMLMVDLQNRKREFGLLRAVGTTQNQLRKMLNRELMIYLAGSLLIALVVSSIASFITCKRLDAANHCISFSFPWLFLLAFVILLMAIYFVFSLYTSGELKNTDIMEAIRE